MLIIKKITKAIQYCTSISVITFSVAACAAEDSSHADHSSDHKAEASSHVEKVALPSGDVCVGYAGQTPRDIDSKVGTNPVKFSLAPESTEMNLCNIHFHNNAEHKAKDFSIYAGDGKDGYGGGYQCGISKSLSAAELKAPAGEICKGLVPGDTIEVHWVHTSCDVEPGPGLGSCLSDACANPDLRVETQVLQLASGVRATYLKKIMLTLFES